MEPQTEVAKKAMSALIERGEAVLGIELGSTRIKGVLIDGKGKALASGSHSWENRLVNGVWTYDLDDVWAGIASCYKALAQDVKKKYGITLKSVASAGFSGMMHGYIALDKKGKLLSPFRTWRNNITGEASEKLTKLFNFAIPQRWSIAHLYQSILNNDAHVKNIAYLTTLSGYIHLKLTGNRVMGVGEASGMFPIDPAKLDWEQAMVKKFDAKIAKSGYPWKLRDILPKTLPAGAEAGTLTEEGAKLIDPSGKLKAGIKLCPPEGDAGTGMVATNSVRVRTGNVSAGTSVFAMLVLEKTLSKARSEIDVVVTPDGKPVGMAHSNNCTSDLDAWMEIFGNAAKLMGSKASKAELYDKLLDAALNGDDDAGGLLHVSYLSGEHLTGFTEGRPLFARAPDSTFSLENVVRSLLFTSLCALRTGLNVLYNEEGVKVDEIRGHGGFFKTAHVGQRIMAAATNTPISLPTAAGEGGAWGMALLAAFMIRKDKKLTLPDYLDKLIAKSIGKPVKPNPKDVAGFEAYFKRYHQCLPIETAAVKALK
ncbi:MAG: FGGY-family carbohydrate kinase [Treponemataceae bacterium]